jgi:lysozyme
LARRSRGLGDVYKRQEMTDAAITEARAVELLKNTLAGFEHTINKFVAVDINQNQFDALVCFVYNIGPENFANSTLLKMLNNNQDKDEVSAQLLRWNKAGGKIIDGLTRRRQAERHLFLK